jgi:hypothetical protein
LAFAAFALRSAFAYGALVLRSLCSQDQDADDRAGHLVFVHVHGWFLDMVSDRGGMVTPDVDATARLFDVDVCRLCNPNGA